MNNFTSKPNPKTFLSVGKHNIKKRFNIWQQNNKTGEIQSSHLKGVDTLEEAIKTAEAYQDFSSKIEKSKYTYHVDVEILLEDSDGNPMTEDGDIAYAITVFPEVNDFCKLQVW